MRIVMNFEALDKCESDVLGVHFIYSDPTPNFDRSLVKELVAELIDIDEKNMSSCTALEVCAGGKGC